MGLPCQHLEGITSSRHLLLGRERTRSDSHGSVGEGPECPVGTGRAVQTDPHEKHDLAAQQPARVTAMVRRFEAEQAKDR